MADEGEARPPEESRPSMQAAGPAELILDAQDEFADAEGRLYRVRVYGAERADGTWIGWIAFAALDGEVLLQTGRETTQSSWQELRYWAGGLEPVYFQGAFARAPNPCAQ